jgi:carbon-monoxide dehydrogenase large subunit
MGVLHYTGSPVPRREDPVFLLGRASYVADLRVPDMLECGFVRSVHPRARLRGVSPRPSAPKSFLWDDMAGEVGFVPPISRPNGSIFPRLTALAHREARFEGEPICAVVTDRSRYALSDYVESFEVDYEPLAPVLDVEHASRPDSPLVYEDLGTNTLYSSKIVHGDPEGRMGSADAVVSGRFVFPANYGAPLEPRGVLAKYDEAGGRLTVWSSTQWPHFVRTLLSEVLGIRESSIRVVAPAVGGGFGNKQDFYREEIVVSWLAAKLKRPVRWVATRSEDMWSTVQSGLQVHHAELGVSREGKMVALVDRVYGDLGSVGPMSFGPSVITQLSMTGPYHIDAVEVDLKCVATNKPPTGAYRGYGQQQAAFVLERLVDDAARRLAMHPLDLRRANTVKWFPYTTRTGRILDSGNYDGMIDACRKIVVGSAANGGSGRIGWGYAFGFEAGGIGPTCVQDSVGARHKGYDSVRVRVEPDGFITVFTGLSPHGQGLETTLSQVCADALGVEIERVRVLHGDTDSCPYGYGTWGSRSAVVGAGGVLKCCDEIARRAVAVAASALGRPQGDLEYRDGWVVLRGSGVRLMSLVEAAKHSYGGAADGGGGQLALDVTLRYEPEGLTISGGIHAALVEVDPQTGVTRLVRYVFVHDSGRMINPLIVEGQLVGGLVQGLGEALLEEHGYSDQGARLASNLMEYALPTALDAPSFEIVHLDTPTGLNPLGVKGVGESGIVGPAAAIANAVADALGNNFNELPLRPDRVWAKLREH